MQVARQQVLAKRTVAAARPCCVRLPARVIKASASNYTSTTSAPATTSTNGEPKGFASPDLGSARVGMAQLAPDPGV